MSPSVSSTIQDLVRVRLPETSTPSSLETYHSSTAQVLEVLASTSVDINITIETVSSALTRMASILKLTNSVRLISTEHFHKL
jgi:hypothetical protein